MPKRVSFKRKVHRVANISMLQRHGERHHIRDNATQHLVGLTSKGKKGSFVKGTRVDKRFVLKTFFSPTPRTRQTAHHLYRGHKAKGGKVAKYSHALRFGERQELLMKGGNNAFFDLEFLDGEVARLNGDWNELIKNWADGKYSAKHFVPIQKVARDLIKKRLVLGKRASRMGRKGWLIMNVSHDTNVIAVLNELLGKNPYSLGFKLPAFNEGLTIYHTTGGKDILEVEGKRFDVTKKLAKFMKTSKKSMKKSNSA